MSKSRTITETLRALSGDEVKPGKYICLPVVSFTTDQPVWIVELYKSMGFLVLRRPDDNSERVVAGSGYRFFEIPAWVST